MDNFHKEFIINVNYGEHTESAFEYLLDKND